jgi:hypothetical protein
LIATQRLEEIEAFLSWPLDKASISSWDLFKQLTHDMQGLLTQACKAFVVLEVF